MTKAKKIRLSILLLVFILSVGAYFLIPTAPVKEHSHKLKDVRINKIEFNTLVNPTNTTLEDIKSKPRVFKLFFTLNSVEVKENIEMLNELHKHPKTSVIAYMLSGTSRAEKFAKRNNVQFPIVKPSIEYMAAFPTVKIPMGFLVDTKTLKPVGKFNTLSIDLINMSLSAVE